MGTASKMEMDAGDDAAGYYGEDAATLGDRIAAARGAIGLTQAGLAARIGVGAKVVSAWENDRSEPRANRLTMLSGMLGVSVSWLLTGVGEGVAPPGEAQPTSFAPRKMALTLPARDLEATRAFYADLLGCAVLEAEDGAVVFEFFGHRLRVETGREAAAVSAAIDVELEWAEWRALVERVRTATVAFAHEPTILDVGAPSEKGFFALEDECGARIGFRAEG